MITTTDLFHQIAAGQYIGLRSAVHISFQKETRDNVSYFTLDQSLLNGSDLLAGNDDNPIQLWDTYDYSDFSDRLVKMEWSRSFEFPYNVQSAIADVTLNNYDGYFTPDSESDLAAFNFPKRPIKLYAGYIGAELVPQFVGLTQEMPQVYPESKVVKYNAMDFLSEIANQNLENTIAMRDVTTDEVLSAIVEQFGVTPAQYSFETGLNTIPFVFFEKGQGAGEIIRKLVQAEGGKFWLDEMGILRFWSRTHLNTAPVMAIPPYSIINITTSGADKIINRVRISAEVRIVQEFQTVYTKEASGDTISGDLWVIPAGGTYTRKADLSDPCYSIVTPTQNKASGVSWFTTVRSGGTAVTSGITATGEIFTNSYEITFTNTNNFAVEVDELELWGEPAKITDVLEYSAYDDVSVASYGEKLLDIRDNQFFQDYDGARSYALWLLRERASYNAEIEAQIKGDFSLQLGDVVEIEHEHSGKFAIDAISYDLSPGRLTTNIKAHRISDVEYFVLDQSQLDGSDVLA